MENTILFSLMTKTMENTMCSSSDDVDDEDYGKHNVFFLSSTWEMFVSMCLNKKLL